MTTIFNDIKFAFRQLKKQPCLACFIVLILAIGIGANTTLFNVIYTVLLRPLSYPEPDALMYLRTHFIDEDVTFTVSAPDFKDWQNQAKTFESLVAFRNTRYTLTGYDTPVTLEGKLVTANYLRTLRRPPILGRDFTEDDTLDGKHQVVLLGHALWQNRFDSDPEIVGKNIVLDGKAFAVIGVIDSNMGFVEDWGSFLVPMPQSWFVENKRSNHFLGVFGRLKTGVSVEQGRAEMMGITERLAQEYADTNRYKRILMTPMHELFVKEYKTSFWVLYGAVSVLLLLTCVNIANLLLIRANRRRQEMAVRLALGAKRWRIIRQMLSESMLLAFIGCVLGLCLANVGLAAIARFAPHFTENPRLLVLKKIGINVPSLLVAVGITLLSAILFGVLPAWHACRSNINQVLKRSGRSNSTGKAHHRSVGMLVVGEVALATILLIGAGLLISSFQRLCHVNPGFTVKDILTVDLSLPDSLRYNNNSKRVVFYRELMGKLRALPGVDSAATINILPMSNFGCTEGFQVEGLPNLSSSEDREAQYRHVSDQYFKSLQIPIKQGRVFNTADLDQNNQVVIVNEALVQKYFPNENPLGLRIIHSGRPKEIIGIVGDIRHWSLADDQGLPMMYEPMDQRCWNFQTIVCRATTNPMALADAVRQAIWSLDAEQPILKIDTIERIVLNNVSVTRLSSWLMSFMACVALILALTGTYAVVAYSVSERVHEFGIRMALGAQRKNIMSTILKKGLVYIIIGLAIGLIGALLVTRLLSSLLYQISATDPVTFLAVSILLSGVVLLACYFPARRAAKIDPMEALRYE
jgi:putative ABC transport system permease protein